MAVEGNGEYPTIIGPDAKFKGDLNFEKGVRVIGQFEGTISSKGQLHVAEGARVKADVAAGNIDVEGEIQGNVTAAGKVVLKTSAKLEGDLRTARLEVADGATFIGNCVVGPIDGSKPPAAKPVPPPAPAKEQPAKDEPAHQPQGKKG